MELPEELVEEVLMRLPVKSVIRFKCVSRNWNESISDPYFRRRYSSRNHDKISRPTGFFYHGFRSSKSCMPYVGPAKFIYTSKSSCEERKELKSLDYLRDFGYVVATSQGLILLSRNPGDYHVYDIVSGKHLRLPKNLEKYPFVSVGFMCKYEDRKDCLDYKVVRAEYSSASTTHKVETYTSETGKWRKSIMKADRMFRLGPHYVAKVIGGVFHWKEWLTNRIVVYNPNDPAGRVKLIELPWDLSTNLHGKSTYEGTRDGSLQWICITDTIYIWILKNNQQASFIDCSNWELTRKVKLSELGIKAWNLEPLDYYSYPHFVDIDPVNKNNIYLTTDGDDMIYSYDQEDDKTESLLAQKLEVFPVVAAYFEWPIWPCL